MELNGVNNLKVEACTGLRGRCYGCGWGRDHGMCSGVLGCVRGVVWEGTRGRALCRRYGENSRACEKYMYFVALLLIFIIILFIR